MGFVLRAVGGGMMGGIALNYEADAATIEE